MSEMYYFVQDILESTFQGFVHVLNLRKGLDMHGRLLFLLLFLFIVFELFLAYIYRKDYVLKTILLNQSRIFLQNV